MLSIDETKHSAIKIVSSFIMIIKILTNITKPYKTLSKSCHLLQNSWMIQWKSCLILWNIWHCIIKILTDIMRILYGNIKTSIRIMEAINKIWNGIIKILPDINKNIFLIKYKIKILSNINNLALYHQSLAWYYQIMFQYYKIMFCIIRIT